MIANFEEVITSFLENQVGISPTFIGSELASHLHAHILELNLANELKRAGIGNEQAYTQDESQRTDQIFWLDRKNENVHEHAFLDLIDAFVVYLNKTCYTSIKGYEFHYSFYDTDAFYGKHLDQFKTNPQRAYSLITYLNANWKQNDGGELKIYPDSGIQHINPENQKCVFFKSSDLLHEVLVTKVPRMSVTGWLKT